MTSKNLLTSLNLVYSAMAITMSLFGAIVFFLNITGKNPAVGNEPLANTFQYVLIFLAPGAVAAGHFIYKRMISDVDSSASLRTKLLKLQGGLLIRSACLEVPGLLASVAAFILRSNTFLLFTAVMVVLFVLWRPTLLTIVEDLNLSQEEKNRLEDPNAQIE